MKSYLRDIDLNMPFGKHFYIASSMLVALAISCPQTRAGQSVKIRYEYDPEGNVANITDSKNNSISFVYDELGRNVHSKFPLTTPGISRPEISFSYDGQNNLTKVIDFNGFSTKYAVDGFGNVIYTSSPDSGDFSKLYKLNGDLSETKDARGIIVKYDYDVLNRLATISSKDGVPVIFEYDTGSKGAIGQLSKISDKSGKTLFEYFDNGNLLAKTQFVNGSNRTLSFRVAYTYGTTAGNFNKIISMTYPSGNTVMLDYSAAGFISSVNLFRAEGGGECQFTKRCRFPTIW